MRIPIREQLGALVLLSCLVCLAVVTIAIWITNHSFVLDIRSSRLSLTASLKAAQLSSNLALMETSVRALTTRVKLQAALKIYDTGRTPSDHWQAQIEDLSAAIDRDKDETSTLQVIVFPNTDKGPGDVNGLFNITASGKKIKLPYTNANGSAVYLGEPGLGYPPNLYPNLTYHASNDSGGAQTVSFLGQELSSNSSILLGPWRLTPSTTLISITLPIVDNTTPHTILGWLTVILGTALISDVVSSPVGLDHTGTTLLFTPNTLDNRFPGKFQAEQPPFPRKRKALSKDYIRFFMQPDENRYHIKRHIKYINNTNSVPFRLSSYPAVLEALTKNERAINNAGSMIKTTNEENFKVSVGYAIPSTMLMQCILLVEETQGEVWAPIVQLRKILLGCVFGTAGGMLLLIFPIAHFSSLPIRRLREATERSIRPQSYSPDEDDPYPLINGKKEKNVADSRSSKSHDRGKFSFLGFFTRRKAQNSEAETPVERLEDSESQVKPFRIPGKVKDRKHWIQDELSDLTETFNEMSDELLRHYEILEERVRARTLELEASKRNAESANESKTLFIANISHELKTPLNGILGMATVALQEDDPVRIKRSLRVIYKSGDLLHNLLTDLLTFSKNQVGRNLTLDEKEFRLREIRSQLHAIFDTQSAESKVNFSIDYEGICDALGSTEEGAIKEYGPQGTGRVKDMHLWGDQHRLLQVAINLLSNSLKFTPQGGEVRMTIRCVGEATGLQIGRRISSESKMSKKRPSYRLWNLARSKSDTRSTSSLNSKVPKDDDESEIRPVGSSTDVQKQLSVANVATDMENAPPSSARVMLFEFEVEDSGPGIPDHLQKQIFEPFVQGDLRLTKRFGGTGLGLSICSQLARLMNGSIDLESEIGVGSKFTFRVPLKLLSTRADSTATSSLAVSRVNSVSMSEPIPGTSAEQAESPDAVDAIVDNKQPPFNTEKPRLVGLSQPFFSSGKPPMASPTTEGPKRENKLRVLVAEDNKVNQEVVLRMLRLEEVFDVHVAKDGQEALDKVKESMDAHSPYDLVLMDIQMPHLDGRESTRKIRQIGYSAPIVALTAFSDEINQRECLESGMDYFLAKPIRRPALKHVLQTYCPTIHEDEEAEDKSLNVDPFAARAPTDLLRMATREVSPRGTPTPTE